MTLDNFSFIGNCECLKLFCRKCCPKNGIIVDLYSNNNNNKENKKLVEDLSLYPNKNKDSSTSEYVNIMHSLIFYTGLICRLIQLMNLQKLKDSFNNYISFLQNYIKSLSSYIEIVKKLNIDNLYLFLRNLFIISTINNDKYFVQALLSFYSKQKECMNVSLIHSGVIEKITENKNIIPSLDEVTEFKRIREKNELEYKIANISIDLANIKFELLNIKNSELKTKIDIMELKSNIINFLRNHNYSFYYIFSKKILELKFINRILFILFKYNHKRFQEIIEDEHIINSIQNELKNILKFLGDSIDNTKEQLKYKISEEIKFLEEKKLKKQAYTFKTPLNLEKNKIKSKNNLVLTDKGKDLLKDYLISDFEDSYSTILASKINNTDRITSKKLQVILEFLFFIRDKKSAIIHLLNEASSLFFQFLNQYSFKKSIDKNEIKEETKNEISDDDEEEEDEYSDE